VLTIASMVQAEAATAHDRPLIASVIYNRLARHMPLQIDSTIIYGRGDPANRALHQSDLERPSPYNTYLHAGLPPTPIGSVSDASLLAAMHPAHTSYLYYVVHSKSGKHAFSSTYEQWQQDVQYAKDHGLL